MTLYPSSFCRRSLMVAGAFFMFFGVATAQNVGINNDGSTPSPDAMLDVKSTNKGVLIPRVNIDNLTTATPVTSPSEGLMVYNENTTTGPGFFYWNGSRWVTPWTSRGNKIDANDFLGTTNGLPLRLGVNDNKFEITALNQLRAFNYGAASIPTYSWVDQNSGMFLAGANTIGFSTSSTERMRIRSNGNVGIGTTNPTQRLHVTNNLRLDGALMPGNDAGTSGKILISNGPNNAPSWGQKMLNPNETTGMGKFYSGPFTLNSYTYLTLTITDVYCVSTSTCAWTWVDLPVGPNYYDLVTTVEAKNGEWVFHIANFTPYNFTNIQFSYFAFY